MIRDISKSFLLFSVLILSILLISSANAQNKNPVVKVSPVASVSQTIGFTDVTINYCRPGVKGRKIWGGLVPYNKVWRAGANAATKFTFSKDVTINGNKLAAGSYAFFALPTQNEWTLIFNKVADQWGLDYDKNKDKDVLKINVKPVEHDFQEWLEYNFTNMDVQKAGMKNSANVNLDWEKLRVSFKIETNTK
ncbi:MAG: DUF2911 domain-containing protein [Ignavibacteriaceae bacterium]